jgi:hypothetical protein
MIGQEMRYLIRTGNCPQCKGALIRRMTNPDQTRVDGDCASCGIEWHSVIVSSDPDSEAWGQTEAYPIGERFTGYA